MGLPDADPLGRRLATRALPPRNRSSRCEGDADRRSLLGGKRHGRILGRGGTWRCDWVSRESSASTPAQVEIANSIFTPTADQIETALRVIEGWEAAIADGKGVFALDGKMVDPPLVDIQQRVIDRAKQAGVLEKT